MSTIENKDVSNLTEEEQTIHSNNKIRMFKITILVCAIYGTISLIGLFIFFLTSWGKIIYNELFPFFITLIIGMISIVVFLSNEIYNMKPKISENNLKYDSEMCPDYWNLKQTPVDIVKNKFTNKPGVNVNNFSYQCKMNNDIFSNESIIENDMKKEEKNGFQLGDNNSLYVNVDGDSKDKLGIKKEDQFNAFKKIAADMSGYTYNSNTKTLKKDNEYAFSAGQKQFNENNIPLSCDTVYPLYMSVMDQENTRKNPSEPSNRFRCAYAKACGVSWTEAGCS